MNNIAPKLQKFWTQNIVFKIISEMLKQLNFFHNQPSTLPKDAPARFYLSTTFSSSFTIRSVADCRLFITKTRNRNLKEHENKKDQ